MTRNEKIARLDELYAEEKTLREDLGIHAPLEGLMAGDIDMDCALHVIADGLGGACVAVVEGNYPVDYLCRHEKHFATEKKAEEVAYRIFAAANDADAEEDPYELMELSLDP